MIDLRRGLVCLAAALAHTVIYGTASAQSVRHLPQSGLQLEQREQSGIKTRSKSTASKQGTSSPGSPLPGHASGVPQGEPEHSNPSVTSTTRRPRQKTDIPRGTSASTGLPSAAQFDWHTRLEAALARSDAGEPAPELLELVHAHREAILALGNADLFQRLGWALLAAQQPQESVAWFTAGLAQPGCDSAKLRYGLALAYLRQGKDEMAYAAIDSVDTPEAKTLRADLALRLAAVARQRGDYLEEHAWLVRAIHAGRDDTDIHTSLAWNALRRGDARDAAVRFESLYTQEHLPDYAQGLMLALQRSGQTERLATLAQTLGGPLATLVIRQEAHELLDLGLTQAAAARIPDLIPELSGMLAPSLRLGALERNKSGTSGTSQLSIRRSPDIELVWPRGANRLTLDLAHVYLNAGDAAPGLPTGSNLPGQPPPLTAWDAGWEPRLRWSWQDRLGWEVSLGTTPGEGPVAAAMVGELAVNTTEATHSVTLRLYAEPVRDSILSYVGLRDPASGQAWGRVLKLGGGVQGYTALGKSGWNLGGSALLEHLQGKQVADNDHRALTLSLTTDLPLTGMRFFSIGPSMSTESYRRNLSGFGWGQGGYFSPQRFASLGAIVVFQTEGAKRWVSAGTVQFGWQSVRQDSGPCFALTPPVAGGACTAPAASTTRGLGSATHLRWAYLLSPHWQLDAAVGFRTGPAFRDHAVHLGLRYHFDARKALFPDDLAQRMNTLW